MQDSPNTQSILYKYLLTKQGSTFTLSELNSQLKANHILSLTDEELLSRINLYVNLGIICRKVNGYKVGIRKKSRKSI